MTVGRDRERRAQRGAVGEVELGAGVEREARAGGAGAHHLGPLHHLDPVVVGERHQRGVELDPAHHRGVEAVGGEGQHDVVAPGRDEHRLVHRLVRRERPHVEAQRGQQPQGAGGEAVAADLVAGKGGLVDDEGPEPEAAGLQRGGDPRRAGPHHEQVGVEPCFRRGTTP